MFTAAILALLILATAISVPAQEQALNPLASSSIFHSGAENLRPEPNLGSSVFSH
jgi:hypothetical protein